MKKDEKENIVNELTDILVSGSQNFYLADISGLPANKANQLRRMCFERGIRIQMVKNTLIRKALENANIDAEQFGPVLKGASSIMFAESFTAPAKLIKDFRGKDALPAMKAAFIESSLYVGDENLDTVMNLKTREQLIGDIIGLLQSPMQNVLSGLKGQGGKIAGILKTLSEKES